jgi:hypothetical protein
MGSTSTVPTIYAWVPPGGLRLTRSTTRTHHDINDAHDTKHGDMRIRRRAMEGRGRAFARGDGHHWTSRGACFLELYQLWRKLGQRLLGESGTAYAGIQIQSWCGLGKCRIRRLPCLFGVDGTDPFSENASEACGHKVGDEERGKDDTTLPVLFGRPCALQGGIVEQDQRTFVISRWSAYAVGRLPYFRPYSPQVLH